MSRRDAEYVARELGKTANWVKRNARRLPHHRAGITYYWTDEDIADIHAALRVRPGQAPTAHGPQPITGTRRTA